MAIKHTAVSYYGLNYVEHAREDFKEMIEHGCDTVILAITEFDKDILITVSTSGKNAVPVEMAQTATKNGIKNICVVSSAYFADKKESPLLYECSDLYIDNCVPHGDAVIEIDGADAKMGSVSTAASSFILQSVLMEAAEIADKFGVKVILNPAPIGTIPEYVREKAFLVTPNEQEEKAIGSDFKNCITTLGEKGCIINGEEIIPAIKTNAVDTTGAGDVFNGVLAVCIAEGMVLAEGAKYATAASGISVGRKYVLNAIPYRDEIERMTENE